MELDQEIDRLYGLPLDEFVRARDEVAKRLRGAGRAGDATSVKALKKPTAGAWALNQAVRRRRRETEALLAVGERLREAHAAVLAGGEAAQLREAMQEERSVAAALADCAEAIASETGKSGPALKERVRATLHAAAVDHEVRAALAAGRFVREREAVGLGPLAATAPPLAAPRRGDRSAPPAVKERDDAAQRKQAEALAAAQAALSEAREALGSAEAEHRDALDELDSARTALADAEARERSSRKAVRESEREVARHEREAARLRSRAGA